MATTSVAAGGSWTGDSLNVLRVQEKLISYMAERENPYSGMIGDSIESAIQRITDLEKQRGDTVKVHLGTKLSDSGVTGDDPLEGNEESMSYHNDSLVIDQWRHAVRLDGVMTEQRSVIPLRKDAGLRLGIWGRETLTELITFYLAGARGVRTGHILPTSWTGHAGNALQSPDSAHILYAGAAGTKAGMAATDKITPALLTKAVRNIRLLINTAAAMRPLQVKGKNYYVAFMPPEHMYDLRSHTDWINAQKDANIRGEDNPLFSGAEGIWNGLVIHEMPAMPLFSDYGAASDVNAARTVICGAQAVALAHGGAGATDGSGGRWRYIEKTDFDYFNQTGFALAAILGVKKLRFNGQDYGSFCVDAAYTA